MFTVACRTCRDSLVSLSDPCRCYLACACISLCYADENLGPRGPRLPLLGSLIAGDSCCRKQLTTQLHRSGETLIRHGRPSLMSGRYLFRGEASSSDPPTGLRSLWLPPQGLDNEPAGVRAKAAGGIRTDVALRAFLSAGYRLGLLIVDSEHVQCVPVGPGQQTRLPVGRGLW